MPTTKKVWTNSWHLPGATRSTQIKALAREWEKSWVHAWSVPNLWQQLTRPPIGSNVPEIPWAVLACCPMATLLVTIGMDTSWEIMAQFSSLARVNKRCWNETSVAPKRTSITLMTLQVSLVSLLSCVFNSCSGITYLFRYAHKLLSWSLHLSILWIDLPSTCVLAATISAAMVIDRASVATLACFESSPNKKLQPSSLFLLARLKLRAHCRLSFSRFNTIVFVVQVLFEPTICS